MHGYLVVKEGRICVSELFFSKRLKAKMEHIRTAGLTLAEAPAGYGKTTFISEALKGMPDVYWYIAVQKVRSGSWQWFLSRLEMLESEYADRLRCLGAINDENVHEAVDILMQIEIDKPIYIVFDNFQYISHEWLPQLLAVFARRKPDGLHIICAAQYIEQFHRITQGMNRSLCTVNKEDLLLRRDEIHGLARKKGFEMTPSDISAAFDKTDGWAVAVAIYMRNYAEYGDGIFAVNDTNELLYNLFWRQLEPEERKILLRFCHFEWIGLKYIDELLPEEKPDTGEIQALLARVPLLEFHESQQRYIPHELLLSFLRFQLVIADEKFHNEVCRRAGDVYYHWKWTAKAVECYYMANDYEKILSCNLVGLLMEQFDGVSYQDMARDVLNNCPLQIQNKYPISVLRLCYGLFAGTAFDDFEKYMAGAKELPAIKEDVQMLGEWLMLSALSEFPDVNKMCEVYEKADEIMLKPSQLFCSEEPFMFGCTSMLYLFYHKCGSMMKTADELDKMMRIYNKMTNGHGAGASELYRAEALGEQGKFEESEILVHKAQLMAEKCGNISVIYGAAQLRGINALYQSDMNAVQKAVEYLDSQAKHFSKKNGSHMTKCMEETVRSYLLALMMETGRSADWTLGEADSLTDLTFTNFLVKLSRTTDLVINKEYRRAIAGIEATMHLDKRLLSMPALSMMYVGLVMCHMAIQRMPEAMEYVDRVLELVSKDKNYVFIACYRKYFAIFMRAPALVSKYRDVMKEIEQLNVRYTRVEKSRIFDMLDRSDNSQGQDTLTGRELEIAGLAAQGYRNSEISQKLHISENTVKSHLKIIFRKLGIDRRNYLKEALEHHSI